MSAQPSALLVLTGMFSKPVNAANTGAGASIGAASVADTAVRKVAKGHMRCL